MVSPVLFQEALKHVPNNAVVVEVAPHSLLQAVLRRALASSCTVVGLMDKRQPDNHIQLLNSLGKYVSLDVYWYNGDRVIAVERQIFTLGHSASVQRFWQERLKAKFHYAIWFEPASNQLRTS